MLGVGLAQGLRALLASSLEGAVLVKCGWLDRWESSLLESCYKLSQPRNPGPWQRAMQEGPLRDHKAGGRQQSNPPDAHAWCLLHTAEQGQLLELEEYFQLIGQDISGALVVDGRYHGWVNPEVCERYGLAGNADEAWEGNGGGTFTFKINKKGGLA